ncbi:uncharacterized protein PHA67_018219 [Liasis olivaceus]
MASAILSCVSEALLAAEGPGSRRTQVSFLSSVGHTEFTRAAASAAGGSPFPDSPSTWSWGLALPALPATQGLQAAPLGRAARVFVLGTSWCALLPQDSGPETPEEVPSLLWEKLRNLTGNLSEGDTGALRTTRTTQQQKQPWRPYRAGSLSALSRGLVKTTGTSREEGEGSAHRQARGAGARRAPRLGHGGAPLPNPTASREIKCATKRGKRLVDSSGFVSPPAKWHPQGSFLGRSPAAAMKPTFPTAAARVAPRRPLQLVSSLGRKERGPGSPDREVRKRWFRGHGYVETAVLAPLHTV